MGGKEIWHKFCINFSDPFVMTTHAFLDRVVVIVTWIIVTSNKHVSSIAIVNYSVHLTKSFDQT